jgi:hypothetical protein
MGVTGQQGMLTPLRHLIPSLVYSEVRVCPMLKFVFSTGLMRLMTVRYLCYFIIQLVDYVKGRIIVIDVTGQIGYT